MEMIDLTQSKLPRKHNLIKAMMITCSIFGSVGLVITTLLLVGQYFGELVLLIVLGSLLGLGSMIIFTVFIYQTLTAFEKMEDLEK